MIWGFACRRADPSARDLALAVRRSLRGLWRSEPFRPLALYFNRPVGRVKPDFHSHNIWNALPGFGRGPIRGGALSFPNVLHGLENAEQNGGVGSAALLNASQREAWACAGVPAGKRGVIRAYEAACAIRYSASPCVLMLTAAFTSRSWTAPHTGQRHCRALGASASLTQPQAEHTLVVGM